MAAQATASPRPSRARRSPRVIPGRSGGAAEGGETAPAGTGRVALSLSAPAGAAGLSVVIPGRSGGAAEGKGIQGGGARSWIPFPALRAAGDDRESGAGMKDGLV